MKRVTLIRAFLRASSWIPLPVAHAIGACLGQVLYWVPTDTRHITHVNLALCFPNMPRRQRNRLAASSFRELGKLAMESGIVWYGSDKRLQRLVINPEVLDTVASLWPEGKGLLVAVPHLGNWELVNLYVNRRFTVNNLYRPPRQADLEPLVQALRERTGANSFPATPRGIRSLYKALRNGELVGVLPDQEPRASGVFAPFFNVPAKTMTLFCQMADKTGAPVLFMFMQRLPWGRGFQLHIHQAKASVSDSDTTVAATALNADIERCVQLAPQQYQWSYKRFRQRPDGSGNPYKPGRTDTN